LTTLGWTQFWDYHVQLSYVSSFTDLLTFIARCKTPSTLLPDPILDRMLSNATQIYAVIVGASFGFLLLVNTLPCIRAMMAFAHRLTFQHLVFPQLLYRNRYLGPWSRADVLMQSCYIAANAFCLGFKAVSLSEAGIRAAHLSLINIAPAFAGPHFSFLADILGVSLHTFRSFHRAAGVLSVMLLAFHVATVMAAQTPFPLHVAKNMGAVVVCACSLTPSASFRIKADNLILGCFVTVCTTGVFTSSASATVVRVVSPVTPSTRPAVNSFNLVSSMECVSVPALGDLRVFCHIPVNARFAVASHPLQK
jgi:hypothetical protein